MENQLMKQKQNLLPTKEEMTDDIMNRIGELEEQGLAVAPNYSPRNALQSAYLFMQDNNLLTADKVSIANSLLNMVIQGLSVAKNQAYFIKYGNKVNLMRSYFGAMKVVKSLHNVKDIHAFVVYEGDEVSVDYNENGELEIKHKTSIENFDNDIIGAYAKVVRVDGSVYTEYMTAKQILASWGRSKTFSKGVTDKIPNNPTGKSTSPHTEQPDQMAKRTVINRASKYFINSSDDNDILIQSVNESVKNESVAIKDVTQAEENNENIKSLEEQFKKEVVQDSEIIVDDEKEKELQTYQDELLSSNIERESVLEHSNVQEDLFGGVDDESMPF